MPSSSHPQAKFDPIPPDLDLNTLVETTDNFDYVARISVEQMKELGEENFERVVLQHVIIGGKPLVIDGWEAELPPWLFSSTWLMENVGTKAENVRDIGQSSNMPMSIGHYIKSMPQLTKNMTPKNFRDPKRQRLYLKDIDCPDAWYQKLEEIIPKQLFYYNESVGEKWGLGAVRERNYLGHMVLGKGVAPAGDLMSSLPPEMRAENFMCYIGHEGTYTPAHREMCASLGQNIMVETSDSDAGEVPGSSVWFMTESKDREVVSEFFLSMLGHDIEIENHFAQINAWKKAPFPVYVVEQKVGDFLLIPPLAPHQVWNRGTRTMKAAWNRTTVETLELAIHEALPRARLVCRDEQYKNKAIIYYTLQKYSDLLERLEVQGGAIAYNEFGQRPNGDPSRAKQLQRDFRRLFDLFTEVMITEMFDPARPEKKVEFIKYDSNVTCSYCRCNIFNRFLTCKSCILTSDDGTIEDTYDICMECYAMGRSCACISNLSWVEQWKWSELTGDHEKWRARVVSILTSQAIDGQIDLETTPQPLNVMRKRFGKTPVAQICQDQLKLRPFRDPSKPYVSEPLPGDSDNEPEVDDEGNLIKKKMSKRKSDQRKKTHHSCHICRKAEENWKLAFCSECPRAYCYGVLYRAFDLMPQTVMEEADWKCPKCLKICSCAACRRDARQKPYQPKGTLLGHDTKKVADYRSVESLVDFGRTNLGWLRGEDDDNPQTSQRMKKLVSKAMEDKARGDQMEDAVGEDDPQYSNDATGQIDPRLGGGVVAPVAPMYANAYEQAGLVRDSQPEYDRYGINGHPEHDDNFHSLYPEPPEFGGRERVMGAGYYLQKPGPNAILYNDPDAGSSQGEQNAPDMEYPKLPPKESEIVYANKGAKRKRPSVAKSTPHVTGDAHKEYVQAQKKQKLSDAKANDKFFMTQNQLDGGTPLVVKLQLPQDFLSNLKTTSSRKARPTRASLRADAAQEDEDEHIADSPNMVKSDVQPVVVNSDDEFDLALQAMNSFKSTRVAAPATKAESVMRKAIGFAKRGGLKTRGTRGRAVARIARQRRGSSEEVDSQILQEANHAQKRRHSTESSHQPEIEESDHESITSLHRRGRPKSTPKSEAQRNEDDFVPSASFGRADRQRRRAQSAGDENSSEDERAEKSTRRFAGKRPGRAPKFTRPVVDYEDDYDENESDSALRTQDPAMDDPFVSEEEELEVVEKSIPKRRGRPPRQTKSLGGIMIEEEQASKFSDRASRRKSAPIAKMVAEEDEVPETQEYTNSFTPLNRREIGGRRLPANASRDTPTSEAAASRRSVRFEGTPDVERQRRDSYPRRFATFDDGDSHSSPEPIDYSIFEDDTVLVDRDDDVDGSSFPRGSQTLDEDGDTKMDHLAAALEKEVEREASPILVEKPLKIAKTRKTAIESKNVTTATISDTEEPTQPTQPKPKRGRPPRKSTVIVIDDDSDGPPPSPRRFVSKRASGSISKVTSSAKHPSVTAETDDEEIRAPLDTSTSSATKPPTTTVESDEDSPPTFQHLEPKQRSVSSKHSPPSTYEDVRSGLESNGETRSPTPPKSLPAKGVGKPAVPAKVSTPIKKLTEEERIIEENRRAKQAILAGLENDDYYSSDYYSASDGEGESQPEPEPEPQPEQPAQKLAPKSVIATENEDEDDDEENAHSVSPYFSKSMNATAVTTETAAKNTDPPESSDRAKKFSRAVTAARNSKRNPGFAISSPVIVESTADTSMLSLADKRAAAGKNTKFAVTSADNVVRDKFGNLAKKDSSASVASSVAGSSKFAPKSGSGMKRVQGIFGASAARADNGTKKVTSAQESDDDDGSDTSIPAFRPGVVGMARRGGNLGMLGNRGAGRGSPRTRGRPRKSG